jgi:hypothetical protein
MLWARVNGKPVENAPGLPDSTLDSISGGIVVEEEHVGPNRYVATLGVLFDRARAGELLGVKGAMRRSAPMLVIPVEWSGATPISFERRSEWQKAWARFRAANSPIDYVRVSGTGVDPVLLNAAQARRPGRGWWRMLLDQYGAADIVVPEVTLFRQWPGGPVLGRFVQIALPLDWPAGADERDYIVSEANKPLIRHLEHWSLWPVMATILTGPRKSGRSLLGRIFVGKSGGEMIDDADRADEEAIFHAWNRAQERRRPLILAADMPPPIWRDASRRSAIAAGGDAGDADRGAGRGSRWRADREIVPGARARRPARADPLSGAAHRAQLIWGLRARSMRSMNWRSSGASD